MSFKCQTSDPSFRISLQSEFACSLKTKLSKGDKKEGRPLHPLQQTYQYVEQFEEKTSTLLRIMISLSYFFSEIHLPWRICFPIFHWSRSVSTNERKQHIEELS